MNVFQVSSLFTSVVVKWSLFDTVSVTAHCSAGSYYKLAQTMYHDENSTFSDKIFFFLLMNRIPQHMHFWHYVICSRIQPGACSNKKACIQCEFPSKWQTYWFIFSSKFSLELLSCSSFLTCMISNMLLYKVKNYDTLRCLLVFHTNT